MRGRGFFKFSPLTSMKKETSARSCVFPSKSVDGKFQNHSALDGVSSRTMDRKSSKGFFFPSFYGIFSYSLLFIIVDNLF